MSMKTNSSKSRGEFVTGKKSHPFVIVYTTIFTITTQQYYETDNSISRITCYYDL
jgi:hypothetical protein